ncbi:MAG: FAD-binding oxidoreductase [Sneathiella sp.]
MGEATKTAMVIGAGIVGVSTAYLLQREGINVTLVDRTGPCAGTSYGNAGALVDKSSVPNSLPGLWKSVPKMLMDPTGPLTLRWSYIPKIAPWLIRFLMEGREERVEHNAASFRALSDRALIDWEDLTEKTALQHLVQHVGWLKVYESDEGFGNTATARDLMDRHKTDYEILKPDDLFDLEPNLSRHFKHGLFQRRARFLINPQKMVQGIAEAFKQEGGKIVISDVQSLTEESSGITAVGSADTVKADKLVLCTGAWSKNLAGQFGAKIPLDTERGYHMMFGLPTKNSLNRPVVYGEKSFVLSPMATGIRMTSQVEFAGLKKEPDFRRIRKLVPHAQKMLPALRPEEKDVWLGYRPSLPDSLPVIGPAPQSQNVFFAFGHHHDGMGLGPTTANIIRDLMTGKEPHIPLWPYRATRFF